MTKTPTEPTTQQPDPQSSAGWFKNLLITIFRLLLLGVGSVSAVFVGMAIATVAPAEVNDTPWLEIILKRGADLRQAMRQSPGAVVDELLGQDTTIAPQLPPSSELSTDPAIDTTSDVVRLNNALRITLPSRALFEDDPNALTDQGEAILETVAQEIQRYPGATVQVAVYSDRAATVARNRQLSFDQAQAIQQYLANMLESDRYHWVTIGYGTAGQRSGNRNLEADADSSDSSSARADASSFHRVELSIILE